MALFPDFSTASIVGIAPRILESSVIQYFLEDLYPEPPMMPDDLLRRHRVRWLMKFIDDPIHPAGGLLTHAISFRKDYTTPEAIAASRRLMPSSCAFLATRAAAS